MDEEETKKKWSIGINEVGLLEVDGESFTLRI